MTNGNETTSENRDDNEPQSGMVRDPQALAALAAASFAGGLLGAVVGSMLG